MNQIRNRSGVAYATGYNYLAKKRRRLNRYFPSICNENLVLALGQAYETPGKTTVKENSGKRMTGVLEGPLWSLACR